MEKDYELIAGMIFERGKYLNDMQVVDRLNELSDLCFRLTQDLMANPTPSLDDEKIEKAKNVLCVVDSPTNEQVLFNVTKKILEDLDKVLDNLRHLKTNIINELKEF